MQRDSGWHRGTREPPASHPTVCALLLPVPPGPHTDLLPKGSGGAAQAGTAGLGAAVGQGSSAPPAPPMCIFGVLREQLRGKAMPIRTGQALVPVQPVGSSPHVPSSVAGMGAAAGKLPHREAPGQPGAGLAGRDGLTAGSPRRWLFDQAVCTLYAFCRVLFGLSSLASLTVLSTVCCLKVCYPAYGRCWGVLSDPHSHPSP